MSELRQEADVLLLAAGYGKRLRPLTETIPKPLIEAGGSTLIEHNMRLLARSGFKRVIINLHYLGDLIREFIGDGSRWNLEVEYSVEPVLLDTGGAIKNIEHRMATAHLLTINSDTVFADDFSLGPLLAEHLQSEESPVATMLLREDPEAEAYGSLGVDAGGRVVDFLGQHYGPTPAAQTLMFAGVQVLSKRLIEALPPAGSIFSITRDVLPGVLARGDLVKSVRYDGYWSDVGTPGRLEEVRKRLERRK